MLVIRRYVYDVLRLPDQPRRSAQQLIHLPTTHIPRTAALLLLPELVAYVTDDIIEVVGVGILIDSFAAEQL